MKDANKTKSQLISEIRNLRRENKKLKSNGSGVKVKKRKENEKRFNSWREFTNINSSFKTVTDSQLRFYSLYIILLSNTRNQLQLNNRRFRNVYRNARRLSYEIWC